jgi:hypothetical protein
VCVDAALCLRHVQHIQAAPILFSLTSQAEEEERIYVEKHVWVKSLQAFSKEEHVWVKGLQALSKEKHCLVSTSNASHPGRSYSLLLNQETLALRLLDSTCMRQAGRDHAPGEVGCIHQWSVASDKERPCGTATSVRRIVECQFCRHVSLKNHLNRVISRHMY